MKKITLNFQILAGMLGILCAVSGCDRNAPTEQDRTHRYGTGQGQLSFWTRLTNAGVIDVTVNGRHTIITIPVTAQGVDCDDSTGRVASFRLAAGVWHFTAVSTSGTTWSGDVEIVADECRSLELRGGGQADSGNGGGRAHTIPTTYFLSNGSTWFGSGAHWTEQFTIDKPTAFVLRFASQYAADAAVITPDQLQAFEAGLAYNGYAAFVRTYGYKYFTLPAGTYYVAARTAVDTTNAYCVELDYQISLPDADRCRFNDDYVHGVTTIQPGGYYIQPFEMQPGLRYYTDGNNTGLGVYIVPEGET